MLHSNQICPTGWKATKEGALRRRRDKAFPKNTVPSCFGRADFYGARVLPALLRVHSRCHHLDVFALSARAIADVCVRKEKHIFSFPKDPLAIMSCWHLIEFFLMYFNSKRINRSHAGGREGRDVSGLPSRSSRSSFPGCFLL